MREEWCPCPFDDDYDVSSLGNVRSKRRILRVKNRAGLPDYHRSYGNGPRKLVRLTTGYLQVLLGKKAGRKQFLVHRLVALAFIPNPDGKETVNHKNGNRADNRVENLEWATHSENAKHSFRVLGRRQPQQGKGLTLTHAGKTQTIEAWSRTVGINRHTIYTRLRDGWSAERALTTPVRAKAHVAQLEAMRTR